MGRRDFLPLQLRTALFTSEIEKGRPDFQVGKRYKVSNKFFASTDGADEDGNRYIRVLEEYKHYYVVEVEGAMGNWRTSIEKVDLFINTPLKFVPA